MTTKTPQNTSKRMFKQCMVHICRYPMPLRFLGSVVMQDGTATTCWLGCPKSCYDIMPRQLDQTTSMGHRCIGYQLLAPHNHYRSLKQPFRGVLDCLCCHSCAIKSTSWVISGHELRSLWGPWPTFGFEMRGSSTPSAPKTPRQSAYLAENCWNLVFSCQKSQKFSAWRPTIDIKWHFRGREGKDCSYIYI